MTTQNQTAPKAPTHGVYFVKKREGTTTPDWIKVGVAWEHGDNEGLNLSLDNLGQNVILTVRRNKPKAE
ncbi:hypothetical protein ACAW74_22845 [Fibrella sp. WM1]|uniref:hypothetical protein n=1 Tax=Fibrella musci TaxID=3242485 RepID=UPI0035226688